MNRVETRTSPPGDNLDALLDAFFKAEMPDPWPAFQAPRKTMILREEPRSSPRWYSFGSRFALAASVGLLLLGAWMIPTPQSPRDQGNPIPTIGEGSAGRRIIVAPPGSKPKPGKLTPEKEKRSLRRDQAPDGAADLKLPFSELPFIK